MERRRCRRKTEKAPHPRFGFGFSFFPAVCLFHLNRKLKLCILWKSTVQHLSWLNHLKPTEKKCWCCFVAMLVPHMFGNWGEISDLIWNPEDILRHNLILSHHVFLCSVVSRNSYGAETGASSFYVSFFLYWDRFLYVSYAVLELTTNNLMALNSPRYACLPLLVLGLRVFTSTPWLNFFKLWRHDNIVYRTLILADSLGGSVAWVNIFVCLVCFHYCFSKDF